MPIEAYFSLSSVVQKRKRLHILLKTWRIRIWKWNISHVHRPFCLSPGFCTFFLFAMVLSDLYAGMYYTRACVYVGLYSHDTCSKICFKKDLLWKNTIFRNHLDRNYYFESKLVNVSKKWKQIPFENFSNQ